MVVVITAVLLAGLGGVVAFAATGGHNSWSSGSQMMGGRQLYRPASSAPVRTLVAARSDAQQFASRLGLRVDEVLQFKRNFYAKLVDNSGNAATEVLVDPASGLVSLEYGPAMMWNTRYGLGHAGATMMGSYGGMMRRQGGSSTQTPTASSTNAAVSLASAHTLAQRWVDANEPSVKVETGGDAFPGYYTLETLKAGRINGMVAVNARTGAVWPHWWHGAFVAKS